MKQNIKSKSGFPPIPYKGLASFEMEDEPLLTGRNDDILECFNFLNQDARRILMMHGASGAGKSSFLKAGLVPHLLRNKYTFLNSETYIIKCSSNPLQEVISSVQHYLAKKTNDLNQISNCTNRCDWLLAAFRFIEGIDTSVNGYVIIIDQVEEVLTQRNQYEKIDGRSEFFEFLAAFSRSGISRVKIVISLRTDYFGRFFDDCSQRGLDVLRTGSFYLKELFGEQLREAIIRPASDKFIDNYGVPRDIYKFYFEEKLVSELIKDLNAPDLGSAVLPVMQIVCLTLYSFRKSNTSDNIDVITLEDYKSIGPIRDQIILHIDNTISKNLNELLLNHGMPPLSVSGILFEQSKWKQLLLNLSQIDSDGTILIKFKNFDNFLYDSKMFNFTIAPKNLVPDFLKMLSKREANILQMDHRQLQPVSGNNISLSLSHDCLAVALRHWEKERNQSSLIDINKNTKLSHYSVESLSNSEDYQFQDLFDGDYELDHKELFIANDPIWDHQIVGFAANKLFFDRLGFKVNTMKYKEIAKNDQIKYDDFDSFLARENIRGSIVIPFPRSIIQQEYQQNSMDIAITNSYWGDSLIATSTKIKIKSSDWVGSFDKVIKLVDGSRIIASDRSTIFFLDLLKIVSKHMGYPDIKLEAKIHHNSDGDIYDLMHKEDYAQFIIGTTPIRAAAIQTSKAIVIDSQALRRICIEKLKEDPIKYAELKTVLNKLSVFNSWNTNIPSKNWRRHSKAYALRLASVALFVVDYVIEHKKETIDYMRDIWEKDENNTSRHYSDYTWMNSIFSSYDFVRSEDYYDAYLHMLSENGPFGLIDVKPKEQLSQISGSLEVYLTLMECKNNYLQKLRNISALPEYKLNNLYVSKCLRKAKKHYDIYNYYDASRITDKIIKEIGKI